MTRLTRTLVVVVACLALSPALWAEQRGNFNVVLGGRQFDDTDMWEPVDTQFVLGANFDFAIERWVVNWIFSLYTSDHDSTVDLSGVPISVELSTLELATGVVKYWGKTTRPYIGGGFSFINADLTGGALGLTASDDDTSVAGYINGGIYWRIGRLFNVGIDGRVLAGSDLQIFNTNTNANYYQAGLILGWGW